MKVRVKLSGAARGVDVGDTDQCTLSQLREKTADTFQLTDRSFSLSLNRKDALCGDDETLSQLGIVAGDLIFVLCHDHSNTNNNTNTTITTTTNYNTNTTTSWQNSSADTSSSSSSESDVSQAGGLTQPVSASASGTACYDMDTGNSEQQVCEQGSVTALGDSDLQGDSQQTAVYDDPAAYGGAASGAYDTERCVSPSPLEDPEVNRCLQEPLLCRESSPGAVPVLLRDVYYTAGCVTATDALWVVLHTVMMEVGFRPLPDGGLSLGEGWNHRGFYKQEYHHLCVSTQHSCSIIGVAMGPTLIVHGVTSGDPQVKTDSQQLKVADYVYGVSQDVCRVYRNLERLSRTMKDLVCQPLLSQLSEVCGFPVSLGLLSLSYEVKLKVLSYLPALSLVRMGQVCREYNVTYKDPCLWRRLYLREFGQHGDNSLHKDWYTLYKAEYLARKERRKMSRQRHHLLSGIPPWLNPPPGHFPPLTPSPYMGGIVGGDYDLNPEFAPRIPHPLFGRPAIPDHFLPQGPGAPGGPFAPRPRFSDPFGPFPGPNYMSGLPNMRPSPFGSLGGNRFL